MSFAASGHNDPGCPAVLSDTVFEGFVDFDDCYFTGPVEVVGCTFRDGSNLLFYARPPCGLGEGASLRVADNRGRLDLIAEGPL